jgi:hypothetical protein
MGHENYPVLATIIIAVVVIVINGIVMLIVL